MAGSEGAGHRRAGWVKRWQAASPQIKGSVCKGPKWEAAPGRQGNRKVGMAAGWQAEAGPAGTLWVGEEVEILFNWLSEVAEGFQAEARQSLVCILGSFLAVLVRTGRGRQE
jgi:hypothetical protein